MVSTPIHTPPYNYGNMLPSNNTPPSNNSSQYSSDYNNHWNRLINNAADHHEAGEISDDDFIQGRELTMEDLGDDEIVPKDDWAEQEMPPIPIFPKQFIDLNASGIDPIMTETRNIKEYLDEDKIDNIVILYNGKNYLTSRTTIEQQEMDALVYECLNVDIKKKYNIVGNLPLYNIKKIGVEETAPEYIYMDGIDSLLLDENWQLYSILPLPDKILASVISLEEAQKIGVDFTGISALHCQNGQGGGAGVIVKAFPLVIGGKKKKTIKRKKKTIKKRKRITNKIRKK